MDEIPEALKWKQHISSLVCVWGGGGSKGDKCSYLPKYNVPWWKFENFLNTPLRQKNYAVT